MVAKLRGLLISGLQYEHGLLADGCARAGTLGQTDDDAAIAHLFDSACASGRSRCQYSLAIQAQFFAPSVFTSRLCEKRELFTQRREEELKAQRVGSSHNFEF